jgi:hypothetical protein
MILNAIINKMFTPLLVILLLLLIVLVFYYNNLIISFHKNIIDQSTNVDDTSKIQLVISRYAENLDWLNEQDFNKYSNIIYNKGDDTSFETNSNTENVINLKNVGRCDHTYLYHIVEKYNNLANITVFLPGSVNIEYKKEKATRILIELKNNNYNSIVLGTKYDNNVKDELHDFELNDWQASDGANKQQNAEVTLEPAKIRPFGAWYEKHFPNTEINWVSYGGIFCVSREEVLQRPQSFYRELLSELENSSNPEVGHYFERSWEAVFQTRSPNTKYIE